jgi:hypothetical protein
MNTIRLAASSSRLLGFLLALGILVPSLGLAQITINDEAKLFDPTPPGTGSESGAAVSVSGNTAAVGAPDRNSNTGAVYIYVRNVGTGVWSMQQVLTASDGKAGDLFGSAVSISGNNVAVGAPGRGSAQGAVYTYNRAGSTWTQATLLTATGGAAGDALGFSVSIEGLTLVAGAPHSKVGSRSDEGTAYVFTSLNSGVTWQQQFHIQVTTGQAQGGDHIGWSVALSQGTILAGAPDDNYGSKTAAGSVYVFVRKGTAWSQQARLNQGGGANSANARFGDAVGLFANTAIVGVDGKNSSKGVAYVFTRSGTTWTQRAILSASDGVAGDHFGSSVIASGTEFVVGAPHASGGGSGSGKAYLFGNSGGVYSELAFLVATDNAAGDAFGTGVSLDAGRAIVGAPLNASASIAGNGAAYSFIAQIASATSITSISPEPSTLNQTYTVSVKVTSSPAGTGTPSGSVSISDGAGSSCTATLNASGTGSCQLASSSAGTLTVSAIYQGDSIFGASSITATHTVLGGSTTTTIVSETPDPSAIGQLVTVTVSVVPVPPATGTPTGAVTVSNGSVMCTVPDISLGNSCQLAFPAAGVTNLTATYGGDANFNTSMSSPPTPHTTSKTNTTTTITSETPDPSIVGQPVTVSVTVVASAGTPTGKVTISNGTDQCVINDVSVASSCQIAFSAAGTTSLTASYAGDSNFNASSSTSVSHTTNPSGTTTAIISEWPDPSFAGQFVQVTVDVAPTSGGGVPTGAVVITDDVDSAVTCTIPNIATSSSCLVTFTVTGVSNLTATYAGDANFGGSASPTVAHTVSAPTALHLAFASQPTSVLRGEQLNGVTVEVRDISNTLQSSDNSTQVTLSVPICGSTQLATFGPVTVAGGVATFTNVGPHFYTIASGLQLGAQSAPAYSPDTSSAFDVLANADILFAAGFENCRL